MKMKSANIILKLLAMIFLSVVLTCGFFVLQSCGEGSDNAATAAQEDAIDEKPTTEDPTLAPTTAEPTEPPTTTEKPPIKTEEIAKWTFSEEDKVFKTGNHMTNFRVEDGILKLTSIGGDPFMYSINANLEMNAEDIDFIKFKILNLSDGYRNQLFFITNDEPGWDEPKSIRNEYWHSEGEEWEILVFETDDCDLWEGTIKQIRFDPLEQEGDIEIEYVVFEKIVK